MSKRLSAVDSRRAISTDIQEFCARVLVIHVQGSATRALPIADKVLCPSTQAIRSFLAVTFPTH